MFGIGKEQQGQKSPIDGAAIAGGALLLLLAFSPVTALIAVGAIAAVVAGTQLAKANSTPKIDYKATPALKSLEGTPEEKQRSTRRKEKVERPAHLDESKETAIPTERDSLIRQKGSILLREALVKDMGISQKEFRDSAEKDKDGVIIDPERRAQEKKMIEGTDQRKQQLAEKHQEHSEAEKMREEKGIAPITREEVLRFMEETCWKKGMSALVLDDAKQFLDLKQKELGIVDKPEQNVAVERKAEPDKAPVPEAKQASMSAPVQGKGGKEKSDLGKVMAELSPEDKAAIKPFQKAATASAAKEPERPISAMPVARASGVLSSGTSTSRQ